MAVAFHTIKEPLSKEIETLNSLVYRSKNQHKSSSLLRKMIHLKRLLRIQKLNSSDKMKIVECAKKLYIIASSILSMGFFVPLCLCVLGVSARIFYLVDRCKAEPQENAIDRMFSEL